MCRLDNADGGHRERRACLGKQPGLKADSERCKRLARGYLSQLLDQPGLNQENTALRRDISQGVLIPPLYSDAERLLRLTFNLAVGRMCSQGSSAWAGGRVRSLPTLRDTARRLETKSS